MNNIRFLDEERFCIRHQKSVEMCLIRDTHTDEKSIGHLCALFAPDWGWCEGPFVSCPPPEFDMTDEWVQSLVPPTDDELLVMYLNSLELEMDFS